MLQLISDFSEFNKYHKCFSYNWECDFELSKYSLKIFCHAIFISDAANGIDQIIVGPGRQGEEWSYILVDLPIPVTFNKKRKEGFAYLTEVAELKTQSISKIFLSFSYKRDYHFSLEFTLTFGLYFILNCKVESKVQLDQRCKWI